MSLQKHDYDTKNEFLKATTIPINYITSINSNINSNNNGNNINRINQLDSEFDQHLASMKKYILDLKEKKSKQLCALWIKKLCEISDGESLNSKNIRNTYSLKLLTLLENMESLQYPFNERPPTDPLKPFEELDLKAHRTNTNKDTNHNNTNTNNTNNNNNNTINSSSNQHTSRSIHKPEIELLSLKQDYSSDQNSEILFYPYTQNSFSSKQYDEKQKATFDYQLRMIEAKFKEEKLNLQQSHSNEIQKLLDRKNNEIESIKSNFTKKKKDYEENIHSLEKKVQSLSRDLNTEREENEKRFNEFKSKIENTNDKRHSETEKKLNELVNKYEKEKFEMQKQHTKEFQDLVDETNLRLKRVEFEYNEQQNINDKVILELENRTHLLKNEMEKNILLIRTLECDNKEKHSVIEALEKKIRDEMNKNSNLENEISKLKDNHCKEIMSLNSKQETTLNQKIKENESLTKKLHNLKEEFSKYKSEHDKRAEKLSHILKEKEGHLSSAANTIKQQKYQAEVALNELKKEIELNSTKLYDEMKEQMTKVENDLVKSKSIRERQSKEFNKQLEELKNEHKKELERLNMEFENEKFKIKHDNEIEKQKMIKNHENLYDQLQNQFQQQVFDNNQAYKLKIDDLTKTLNENELKIVQLEQELIESNTLRKHQITELGLLREDEKNKINRNYELEIENLKIKIDQDEINHKKKLKEVNDDYDNQMKMLVKQSDDRIKKLNEKVIDLEEELRMSKNEVKRLKELLDKEKKDSFIRLEEEKCSLKKYFQNQFAKMEQELESETSRNKNIEKKLKQITLEQDQYVTNIKLQYEEKLKGLIPIELKKDYEETISALKTQIDSLQQRTILLQSELDDRNQLVNSSYTASL